MPRKCGEIGEIVTVSQRPTLLRDTISPAQHFAFLSDDNGADTAAMEVRRSGWPNANDTTRTKVENQSVRHTFGEVSGLEPVKEIGEILVAYRTRQQSS